MNLRKNAVPVLIFILLLPVITAACSLRRQDPVPVLGSDTSLAGEAFVVCSQECAERGQCGSADQGKMVLLNASGPATSEHNMAIAEGSPVLIDHEESRPAIQVSNNEPMTIIFYLVNVPERGPGWVAGWCLGQ